MSTIKNARVDFILHCQHEKKLSPKTLKFYEIDLVQFHEFVQQQNFEEEICKIDKTILRSYLHSLSSFKPKTIKRKIATLKAFFNFMEFEDKIVVNPFRKVRFTIKEPKILPIVMTLPEIQKVFSVAYLTRNLENSSNYKNFESIRNIAVIETLFATGIRVSELSNLKDNNVNLEEGFIKVCGKGNKERVIQICNSETIGILKQYANAAQSCRNIGVDSFFINRLNQQLSDQSIRNIVKKITIGAEISKHITPHVFRHTTATLLLEEGVDIKYIQTILGHSSIVTTQIYTHVNSERQRAILRDKHPRKSFAMSMM